MKKINCFFTCFFLIFLILSAVPSVISSASWLKRYWILQYDSTMKKYYKRVYPPARRLGSPYRSDHTGSMTELPRKNRKTKHFRPFFDFLKNLFPEQKEYEKKIIAVFPFRDHFSEFNMAVKRAVGMKQPIEYDEIVLLPHHSLCQIFWEPLTRLDDIREYQKVSREVKAKFFYLVRPISSYSANEVEEIYPGLFDYTNQQINDGIKVLRKMKIPYLDLRQGMGEFSRNSEFRKFFFKGDHHWNVDGALLAAKLTAEYMNRHFGTEYDLRFFDPDVFHRVRYKDIFIGSLGKKLSLAYLSGKEDFDILYPDYKTDFTFEEPFRKVCIRGNFTVMFPLRQNNYNSYHANSYGVFLHGYKDLFRITNHLISRKHGKKFLIINDSFGRSCIPYLALQTREIVMVDPRTIGCDEILKHIRREKPDIVINMFWLHFDPASTGMESLRRPPEKK